MDAKEATPTAQTELKDFVQQTIQEILEGVEEARENTAEEAEPNYSHTDTEVHFDLAVTSSQTGGTSGKFGIGVAKVVEMGIEGQEGEENTATNRVQFSIPLQIKPIPSGGTGSPSGGGSPF